MKKMAVTYGQLDKVLRSLGFTSRVVKGNPPALRYDHKETGASFTFPPLPANQRVWEHHFVTAKVMVDQNGIADPEVFEAKLQKVG
jgi:hypothetical protein